MKELFTKYFREAASYQSIDPTCFDLQEFTETWLISNKEAIDYTHSCEKLKEKETKSLEEKLVEWLCEEYSYLESIQQVSKCKLKVKQVIEVEYSTGTKDLVYIDENDNIKKFES